MQKIGRLFRKCLGYVCNPRSLMEGTKTLCRDDIRGFTWEPQSSLTSREKRQWILASGFCIPEPLPVHTGINRRQVHPLIRFFRWWAENVSLAPSDGSRLWHGDITAQFPPSGNEGYIRNRDVSYLSVTSSYFVTILGVHGKNHNLNPVTTLWHCKCWQATAWQTNAMQRS